MRQVRGGTTMIELLAADWNHWPDGLSPAEIAVAAATAGVDGLELGVYDTRVSNWPGIASTCGVNSVPSTVSPCACCSTRCRPNGGRRADSPRRATAHASSSRSRRCSTSPLTLGLETVGLWPGADLPGADRDTYVTRLSEIAELAHRAGMRVAVEPKPGTLTATAGDVCDASEQVARA